MSASASPGVAAGGARQAYTTLARPATATHDAKTSKFVATAWPVSSPEQAGALITAASDPAACHTCWAFAVGGAGVRCSDDGEPAGTAGRPILAAISGAGLDGVALLVTRHRSSSAKLGTGGLVRAYGAAARECLAVAERVEVEPASSLTITAPLRDVGCVYDCLAAAGGVRASEERYEQGGSVLVLNATVPRAGLAGFLSTLKGRTAGRAGCEVVEE